MIAVRRTAIVPSFVFLVGPKVKILTSPKIREKRGTLFEEIL